MNRSFKIILGTLILMLVLSFFVFVNIDLSSKTSLLIADGSFTAAIVSLYIATSNWKRETHREKQTEEKKRILFLSLCEVTMDHYTEAVCSFNNVKKYNAKLQASFDDPDHVDPDCQARLCKSICREIEFNKIK